jgi:ribonuclease HI
MSSRRRKFSISLRRRAWSRGPQFISEVRLVTDGGSRGNPGPGAIGIIILDNGGNELERHAELIGVSTNNEAEYKALAKGLDLCAKHTRGKVDCFLDSQLVVYQMNGHFRLKDDTLRRLYYDVKKHEWPFDEVVYTHVPNTDPQIMIAHRLLSEALEGR